MTTAPESHTWAAVETARSWLFVPADRPDRFDKAVSSGADIAVLDLEDGVGPANKQAARAAAVAWFTYGGRAAVRVNEASSTHHQQDVAAIAGLPGVMAVILPMATDAGDLGELHRKVGPGIPLVAQIETAVGLFKAAELEAVDGVTRLAFGHLDFAFDVDCSPTRAALAYARSMLVVASRVAGLAGPVDSVTTELDDSDMTIADTEYARELGLTGKLCIHPSQVATVNAVFRPTEAHLRWAKQVAAVGAAGAARVDGQMIDAPVIARAMRIIAQSGRSIDRA